MKPLDLFNETKSRVPAYKQFLDDKGFNFSGRWEEIPIIDKQNYLLQFPTIRLCRDASLKGCHLIGASSGFSKSGSVFWPKRAIDEKDYLKSVEHMLVNYYAIDKKKTLIFVCLAFGTWIGGMQLASAMRTLASSAKYDITACTPSLNLSEAAEIYSEFGESFDQFIWITNPSNINLIMYLLKQKDLKIPPGSMYFPVVGEFFAEGFRNKVEDFFGHSGDNAYTVWTGYGSADTGDIAVETAELIRLRKYIYQKPELSEKLFGTRNTPFLMNYFPDVYVEIIDGHIVVTKDQMIPLVRYNSGDRGDVLSRDYLSGIAEIPEEIIASLPDEILCIAGRADNEIIFYGTNLSLEEINDYLNNLPGEMNYGGFYEVEVLSESGFDLLRFYIHTDEETDDATRESYQRRLVSFLKTKSNEFRAKYENLSKSAGRPLIEVITKPVDPGQSEKKHKFIIKG
jgi:phenylacetate-CoA ligase